MGQQLKPGPARDAGKDAQYRGRGSGATGKGELDCCLAVENVAALPSSRSRPGSGRNRAPISSNLHSGRQAYARIPGASLRKRDGKSSPPGFRVPGTLLGERLHSSSSRESAASHKSGSAEPSIWAFGRRICGKRISGAHPRWTLPGGRSPDLRHASRRSGKGAVSGNHREFPDHRRGLRRIPFSTNSDAAHKRRAAALGSIYNSSKGGDKSERWHFYPFWEQWHLSGIRAHLLRGAGHQCPCYSRSPGIPISPSTNPTSRRILVAQPSTVASGISYPGASEG
jgi:hypothetical protein